MPLRTVASFTAGDGAFHPGDIVALVTGGPDMVVVSVCDDCGEVETVHTNSDDDIEFNTFPAVVLELAA
jgi:hypothetical protein